MFNPPNRHSKQGLNFSPRNPNMYNWIWNICSCCRLYFRCSYREDRHCLASKLLQQKNDDDPPLYEVTYTYEHTCGAPPVSFPDIVAEPPVSTDGLVLRFDSPSSDAWMQQNGRYHSTSRSAFMMLSFGSSSQTHDQQPAVFRSDLEAGLSSFPTEGLPPAPPPANDDDGDMLSKLNSFAYDFDNQMHFGDHTYLPHNSSNYDHDDHWSNVCKHFELEVFLEVAYFDLYVKIYL